MRTKSVNDVSLTGGASDDSHFEAKAKSRFHLVQAQSPRLKNGDPTVWKVGWMGVFACVIVQLANLWWNFFNVFLKRSKLVK